MTTTMTEPQTLNVEYDELMGRADELEAPIPGLPYDSPVPPSNLAHATGAAAQLAFSGDDMRRYIAAGQREWSKLAESLRNAAKAYEEVDETAAQSIDNDMSMSAAPADVTDEDMDALILMLTDTPQAIEPLPTYYPVRDAAYDIADPDQGVAFDRFADEWTTYQGALVTATSRFRPFEYWDGTATDAVESNMEQHRDWLFKMADICGRMAEQARRVASAQRWALPVHPTIEQVEKIDYYWTFYQTDPQWQSQWPELKVMMEENYQRLQDQSEEVLAEYATRASLPLPPAQPPLPPTAYPIAAPNEGGGGNSDGGDSDGGVEEFPEIEDDAEDEWSPTTSGGSGGTTSNTQETPTDVESIESMATPEFVPGASTAAGMKPASFGGGGIGGGVPAMPLQPRMGSESVPPAAVAPSGAQPGVMAGARAPMGAGGMGMPMGGMGGAQNQKDNKAKHALGDEQSLYKEDRAWTASIIGNRRRNDAPDSNQ